jgi:hypothetical protein
VNHPRRKRRQKKALQIAASMALAGAAVKAPTWLVQHVETVTLIVGFNQ